MGYVRVTDGSVLTLTDASLLIEIVACWTLTLEAAKCVNAVPPLTETWQLLALINVCQSIHINNYYIIAAVIAFNLMTVVDRKLDCSPSRITVMGLGLNPSPPGQRVLYSAIEKKTYRKGM